MDLVQLVLIVVGLLVAVGGGLMLVRGAGGPESGPRRAYTPIGMIVIGGIIAYRAYSDFGSMDTQDLVITSLFVVALLTLLGLQFFVADKRSAGAQSGSGAQNAQTPLSRPDTEGSE